MNKKSFLLFLFIIFLTSIMYSEKRSMPPKYKKWIKEEVVYIITPAEKEVFYKLETDKERDRFIEEFWRQRDPIPGTPRNEFKDEHYKRIKHVNEKKMWGQPSGIEGWRTDRGKIYITLGKSQSVMRFSATEIYPVEIWYYQGNPSYGQPPHFRILFFKRHGAGDFRIYNPISDGPRSLTPLAWQCGSCSTDDDYDVYAYNLIKENVSVELASASVSSFPGQGLQLDTGWTLRMPSTILVSEVHTYPHRKVQDDYAYEFLEHKASVKVSYSAHYMGNRSRVDVLQDPSGIFFVNYALEPETLSVDYFEDKYLANLKVSIRVANLEEKTIFQQERNFPIEMREEQLKKIEGRPFHLYDSFPLIPGSYRFNLLVENTVSKEFTSVEKDVLVPESGSSQMSSLILANRINEDSPYRQFNKAFKIGNLQVYPLLRKNFSQKDKFYLFFQVYNLTPNLEENGILEYAFHQEEQQFQTIRKKLSEYKNKRDFLQEFSLEKFPPGQYTLKVSLLDGEGNKVLFNREEFSVSEQSLPESWMLIQTYPASDDPLYSALLGHQFLNKGEMTNACEELERAYSSNTDSLPYALNYARALLALNEYERTKESLIPFSEKPVEKFIIYKFLGIAHQGLKEYEKAISFYRQYISHEGASFEILNSIALCHYQSGDEREALRAWEKSLEINPDQDGIKEVIKILKERIKNKK